MAILSAGKVTLNDTFEHYIIPDMVLVVAIDCMDESDRLLMVSKPKHIKKNVTVVVKDLSDAGYFGAKMIRAYSDHILYYLDPMKLKLLKDT